MFVLSVLVVAVCLFRFVSFDFVASSRPLRLFELLCELCVCLLVLFVDGSLRDVLFWVCSLFRHSGGLSSLLLLLLSFCFSCCFCSCFVCVFV